MVLIGQLLDEMILGVFYNNDSMWKIRHHLLHNPTNIPAPFLFFSPNKQVYFYLKCFLSAANLLWVCHIPSFLSHSGSKLSASHAQSPSLLTVWIAASLLCGGAERAAMLLLPCVPHPLQYSDLQPLFSHLKVSCSLFTLSLSGAQLLVRAQQAYLPG